jgi:hypothetical protein
VKFSLRSYVLFGMLIQIMTSIESSANVTCSSHIRSSGYRRACRCCRAETCSRPAAPDVFSTITCWPRPRWIGLCTRRDRPRGCHAANRDNEFSPSDADCHVTSRGGHTHAMKGRYYALVARLLLLARTEAPNWSLPRARQSSVTLPPN